MDIGYDLFLDGSTLKTTFVAADVLDANSDLKQLDGKVDIVHAASFFHLFDLDDQTKAAIRLVKVMKDKSGCLVIGRQIGNVEAGHKSSVVNDTYKRFRHNGQSFADMWKKVGDETGTKWEVDARIEPEDLHLRAAEKGLQVGFIPPGSRWLSFTVRRVS